MAISITGIRVSSLCVSTDDVGHDKITAQYRLVTNAGKPIGSTESLTTSTGYGERQFTPSPETIKALADASKSYRNDIAVSLGLDII